jgi:heme-degrading monooxygenase HmoA
MEIITMVTGKISESNLEDFKAAYASLKDEDLPEGLIASYLLKDMVETDQYTVETVWADPETLRRLMEADETTSDVKLFEKFDVEPSVKIHEVSDNYPQYND